MAEQNVMKMTPGPTRYAISHAHDIASTFYLFITPAIEKIILEMTNLEGFRKYGDSWKRMDETDLHAYIGLLILAGVYRSRGRCPFRQYMPSKPAKYGIKSWVACDAKSSYAWKMQVYTGKPTSGGPEKNQGMRVVLDVTEGLRGHNVTCDNFFTSYELGQQLLKRKITMVGTVRKNKPELPPALLASKEREVFSSKFATTTLVSYLPKKNKNVVLLSTLHTEADISDREDRKPGIILDYNCNKGGVDNLDKVIGTYSCRRMTAR
ncbi:hypothetical protein AAFF_G00057630 [Aldrovandia affinis]|uniref:PiggyBac transposable element-derived protein domain-containing protein n=1 Tax=Aldrovandia affinis TaxID=143900 RepID=A0AAD7S0P1_9TELE|nr:hypothetical protein AAFF_G00057630 [Aldrovandia affinis]